MLTIPREQMEVLDQMAWEQFRHQVAAYLRRTLPEETAVYDDQTLVAYIKASERRAARRGIETEYGIAQWTCLALLLGFYFDDDPLMHEYLATPKLDPEGKLEAFVDGFNDALLDLQHQQG